MAATPAPFSDDALTALVPLLEEALRAFGEDVSYGVAMVQAGRKVAARRERAAATALARQSAAHRGRASA